MLQRSLLSLSLIALLSLPALACGNKMGMDSMDNGTHGCCDKMGQKGKGVKEHKSHKGMGQGCQSGGGMGCMSGPRSLAALNLTTEQEQKMATLHKEFKAKMAELHLKEKKVRDPLLAIENGAFSKELFKKQMKERMDKHLELKAEHFSKMWDILTADQKQKLTEIASEK